MSEEELDRSEQATPFRLREARRKGQVPKGQELISLLVLVSAYAGFILFEPESPSLRVLQMVMSVAGEISLDGNGTIRLYGHTLMLIAGAFWSFVALIVFAGMLGNFIQTGPVFSVHPLKPDFNKLNPKNGFKRIFSSRTLYEFIKTLIKLLLLGLAIYAFLRMSMPALIALVDYPAKAIGSALAEWLKQLAGILIGLLVLVTVADVAFSRWDFARRMRMSRRQVREEVKRREGDPQIRSRIRQLQRENANRARSLKNVPNAHLVVTNPTHLAVAVRYDRGRMAAPIVSAKGAGDLAVKIRSVARTHGIPVVENRALARKLFREVSLDQPIPSDVFEVVARLLVWSFSLRRQGAVDA